MRIALASRTRLTCSRKLAEPRTDGRKRAHEATRSQELPAPAPARGKIIVEVFLIDLVYVEETIGGAVVESGVLDVLAENAHTLLVAATKEICAGVMVKALRNGFVGLVMPL